MTTTRSYLVLPVVAAATATTAATAPWPDAAWRVAFDRSPSTATPVSVADFWHQASGGEIDLRFRHHPAVVRDPADPAWTGLVRGSAAGALLRTIVTSSIDLAQLRGVDGVVVVASRTAADSAVCTRFTVPVPQLQGDPIETEVAAVYLGWHDSQSVYCHELGHALGFPHPFGVLNSNGGTEYGSPPCVMGTASRWSDVSAPLTPPPGSPLPASAGFWSGAGPDLSRASYARWALLRGLPTGAVPGGADPVTIGDRRSGVARAASWLDDASGEVIVAEVRRPLPGSPVDWDAALRLDVLRDRDVYDAPGVVVHRLEKLWSHDYQVTYLGTVPLPLGLVSDLEVTYGRRLRVRVLDADAGIVSVTLSTRTSTERPPRYLRLAGEVGYRVPPRDRSPLGEIRALDSLPYRVGLSGPRCTFDTFWGRRVDRIAEITVRAQAVGLDEYSYQDQLEVQWSVAGQQAPRASRLGEPPVTWTATLTTDIAVPDGDAERWEQGTVTLDMAATWDTLRVLTTPGQGRYRIAVGARVGQIPGTVSALAEPVTATTSIEVTTALVQFGAAYHEARAACEQFLHHEIQRAQHEHPSLAVGAILAKVLAMPIPRLSTELADALATELRVAGRFDLAPVRLPDLGRRGPSGPR